METESVLTTVYAEPNETQKDGTLEALLDRPVAPRDGTSGVRLGVLQGFDEQGRALVQTDDGRLQVCMGALAPLSEQDVGRSVALGFDTYARPIVLGLLWEAHAQVRSTRPLHVEQDGERTVIEAEEELELRCGEAVILLQADGHIQLRGVRITSHASVSQRIRGGSVQIN